MDWMGPSIEDLFHSSNRRFSHGMVLTLGIQLVKIISFLHDKGFIHRNIHPSNIAFDKERRLNIVDLSQARHYAEVDDAKQVPRQTAEYRGDLNFASLNVHRGLELSKRDDLESVAYVIIYLCKGGLPWQAESIQEDQKLVGYLKEKISPSQLCASAWEGVRDFLKYCRELSYGQTPDYQQARKMLRLRSVKYSYDFVCDWTVKEKDCPAFYSMKEPQDSDEDSAQDASAFVPLDSA